MSGLGLNKYNFSRAILITEHHDAFKQCLVIHSCLQPQRFPHQYSTKHFRSVLLYLTIFVHNMHRINFGKVHTTEQKDKPYSSPHTARPSESKWSPSGGSASNSSLAHELWKVPLPPKALSVAAPTRPPPGLTSQKLTSASSGWDSSALRLGGWGSESRYTPGKNTIKCFVS